MEALKFAGCVVAGYLIAYLMVSFYWVSFDPSLWSGMGRFIMLMIGFWAALAISILSEAV